MLHNPFVGPGRVVAPLIGVQVEGPVLRGLELVLYTDRVTTELLSHSQVS